MLNAELLRACLLTCITLASAALAHSPLQTRTDCLRYSGSLHLMDSLTWNQEGWLDKGQNIDDSGGLSGQFRVIPVPNGGPDSETNQGTYFFVNCGTPFHVYCDVRYFDTLIAAESSELLVQGCDSKNGMDLMLGIQQSGNYWFPTAVAAASRDTEVYRQYTSRTVRDLF